MRPAVTVMIKNMDYSHFNIYIQINYPMLVITEHQWIASVCAKGLPGCWCLAAWSAWTSVRAAHLLQTAEGRRALLETICSRHCSIAELSTVRMETVRVNGASSRRWSWPWTVGPVSAVPPVHCCSPQAEGVALLLAEADVPDLFRLWWDRQHSGYKPLKMEVTILQYNTSLV